MSRYHVCFFKNLLSSDGHRFRCLQQEIDVPDAKTPEQAAKRASRTFESVHGVADWKLLADAIEVSPGLVRRRSGTHRAA